MYPHVTQFETRDALIAEQIRVREERRALRPQPRRRRAPLLRLWLARMLRFA